MNRRSFIKAAGSIVVSLALMPSQLEASPNNHMFHGLCYGPFRQGQSPETGIFPSEAQVREDLEILAKCTENIRTYGVDNVLYEIPRLANDAGINCYPGAWIDNQPWDAAQITALKALGNLNYPSTKGLIVGNEYLYRHGGNSANLISHINDVRNATGDEVAASEQWHVWRDHPALIEASDFIFVHIHPYWEQKTIDQAVPYVVQRYNETVARAGGKKVIVSETGWPSAGNAFGAAVPSMENHMRFIAEFRDATIKYGIESLFFEAFNEPWKSKYGVAEANWGVIGNDRHDKGGISRLLDRNAQVRIEGSAIQANTYEEYPYTLQESSDLKVWTKERDFEGTGAVTPQIITGPSPRHFYRVQANAP